MDIPTQARVGGAVVLLIILGLLLARRRQGSLTTAAWLTSLGAFVVAGEHAQFALSLTLPYEPIAADAAQLILVPHARLHFFMAGIYALVGLALLCVLAWTLLRAGRRVGWYALLGALLVGGGFDLLMGGLWFQHGSPIYFLGDDTLGFGWEGLYPYLVVWGLALAISYRPIFRTARSRSASSPQLAVARNAGEVGLGVQAGERD